ncbi:unnamed protein product [Caenorhabditis bovis]|uniref:G-protein coupled receptors family 1 profile domain-containing protein n=1 Tax=Caenorhabditis bovis TaxID=2654633 RepID=A0A8S1FEW9_9PELO|nr:unnamed protein product [Caenorhabditis bovis]
MERYEFYAMKSWFYVPVILIGLLGNFASFLVYRTTPMRKSTVGTLLLIVSLIDILLLILIIPIFVLVFLPIWDNQWERYSLHMSFFAYSTRYVYPLCMMTKSCSLYFMVLITIERWIAVCRPLQAKLLCTNRNTMKAGICIVIFSILFNFPRFFDYKIGPGYISEMWMLDVKNHFWYFIVYFVILSVIFDYFLPILIMAIANYYVIKALRYKDESIGSIAVQRRKEQNTTVMLLVVTIFFAFCHLFSMFLKLAECIVGDFLTQSSFVWEVFAEFTTFLIIFHTSSTFFIYYGFSEKFRTTFHEIITCREKSVDDTKCSGHLLQTSMVSDAATKRKFPGQYI